MTETKREQSHAEQNAACWLETIKEHVACLGADRERLEELRFRVVLAWAAENPDDAEELAALVKAVTIEGTELDADACRERIQESPLSVQVRYGWISPGATTEMIKDGPEEYEILLTTGGPAARIIGRLDRHCQPDTARLQYQDWGTPWTELFTGDDYAALLTWASVFYFGD